MTLFTRITSLQNHFAKIVTNYKICKQFFKPNLRQPFENSKMTVTSLMWPWDAMINGGDEGDGGDGGGDDGGDDRFF